MLDRFAGMKSIFVACALLLAGRIAAQEAKEYTPRYFPLKLHFEEGRAWVVRSYDPDVTIERGTELETINGETIPVLVDRLFKKLYFIGSDSLKYAALNHDFDRYYTSFTGVFEEYVLVWYIMGTGKKELGEVGALSRD